MVEQIQTTPPYDVLSTLGTAASDTKSSGTQSSTHAAATPSKKEDDTITLSAAAQANQLYEQGNSVSQIAALLGLPTATVDNDLNLNTNSDSSTTTQSVQPTTSQTPATQVSPADGATASTAASSPYTAPAHTTSAVS